MDIPLKKFRQINFHFAFCIWGMWGTNYWYQFEEKKKTKINNSDCEQREGKSLDRKRENFYRFFNWVSYLFWDCSFNCAQILGHWPRKLEFWAGLWRTYTRFKVTKIYCYCSTNAHILITHANKQISTIFLSKATLTLGYLEKVIKPTVFAGSRLKIHVYFSRVLGRRAKSYHVRRIVNFVVALR